MPASNRRSAARLAVLVLLVMLAGGCTDEGTTSSGASQATTAAPTTTVAATTTTVPPMTAEELAWLKAVTALHKKMEKAFSATSVYLTRAKMTSYANTLRSCSRELARIGPPGDRLEPVHVIVKKACRTLTRVEMLGDGRKRQHGGRRGRRRHPGGANATEGDRMRRRGPGERPQPPRRGQGKGRGDQG